MLLVMQIVFECILFQCIMKHSQLHALGYMQHWLHTQQTLALTKLCFPHRLEYYM